MFKFQIFVLFLPCLFPALEALFLFVWLVFNNAMASIGFLGVRRRGWSRSWVDHEHANAHWGHLSAGMEKSPQFLPSSSSSSWKSWMLLDFNDCLAASLISSLPSPFQMVGLNVKTKITHWDFFAKLQLDLAWQPAIRIYLPAINILVMRSLASRPVVQGAVQDPASATTTAFNDHLAWELGNWYGIMAH